MRENVRRKYVEEKIEKNVRRKEICEEKLEKSERIN